MKCKKTISDLAQRDIREIALWHNTKSKGLGKRFTTEVRIATNYIVDFPEAFQSRYDGIRVATVAVFPYCIHYYFDTNNNTVFVVGVYRDSRDPEIWKERNL
jgi:plasmid stabilization system protein ParE